MLELVFSLLMIDSWVHSLLALQSASVILVEQSTSNSGGDSIFTLSERYPKPLRQSLWRMWGEMDCPKLLVAFLRVLDALLKRYYSIYEFSRDESCLLRLAIGENDQEMMLADGTNIPVGELIGELHLWNEHVPPMARNGPDLAWARTFQRRMTNSLRDLVLHIEANPAFESIRAFRGECHFGSGTETKKGIVSDLLKRWSFELTPCEGPKDLLGRIANFWDNVYTVSLIWAFNPASLKGKSVFRLKREYIWISKDRLIVKYGSQDKSRDPAKQPVTRRLRAMEESRGASAQQEPLAATYQSSGL